MAQLAELRLRGLLRDFVIVGGVARALHDEARATSDLDVVVRADSEGEYRRALSAIQAVGEAKGAYPPAALMPPGTPPEELPEGPFVFIAEVPVHTFPSAGDPLIEDTLATARRKRVAGRIVKIALAENMALLALRSSRPQKAWEHLFPSFDRARAEALLGQLDDPSLWKLWRDLLELWRDWIPPERAPSEEGTPPTEWGEAMFYESKRAWHERNRRLPFRQKLADLDGLLMGSHELRRAGFGLPRDPAQGG